MCCNSVMSPDRPKKTGKIFEQSNISIVRWGENGHFDADAMCNWLAAVPLQTWSGPQGSRKLRFPDFTTTAQDGGNVVSLTHQPHLPPRKYSWYLFLLEVETTLGTYCDPKDFISMKYPLNGIEPATFRFVAQHLNHCPTACPNWLAVFRYLKNVKNFCQSVLHRLLFHLVFPSKILQAFSSSK